MITILISGLLLGLVSSLHCVGMCGPLVMSLPMLGKNKHPWINLFLYNGGRIFTYIIFGFIFHFLGRHFYLAGFQKSLTILMGILLVGFAVYQWIPKSTFIRRNIFGWINVYIINLSKKPSNLSLWLMGMLNGCLPCGMVYLAIASSLAFQNSIHGALYMLTFGIGTLPLLFGTCFLGWRMKISTRQYILKIIPFYALFMGLILVLRGMELGIPFISPILPQKLSSFIHCF